MEETTNVDVRGSENMNAASRWRFAVAQRVARPYAENPNVAAIIVGGSTGRGHADRYSDLEMGVFWHRPPAEEERLATAQAAGGEIHRLWPYDPEEEVWSDDVFLGRVAPDRYGSGLLLERGHYTVGFVERTLTDVLERYDPSELKQNVVSAIVTSPALHGQALVAEWRSRAATYPSELALAVVRKHAQIDHFWRTEMFLARGPNLFLLNEAHVQIAKKLLHVLLALNRIYHQGFKWSYLLFEQMQVIPPDFGERLRRVFELEPRAAARELQSLVEETYDLIEEHMPEVDVEWLRYIFRYQRHPWDEPPPGLL